MWRLATALLILSACAPHIPDRSRIDAITSSADGVIAAPPPALSIVQMAWLAGCWEAKTPEGSFEEYWMPPRGGAMVGMGRSLRNDRMSAHESLLLWVRGDRLAYEATPSGQVRTTFLSTVVDEPVFAFENPGHDFPNRIAYHRTAADSVTVTLDGVRNGSPARVRIELGRVECPSGMTGDGGTR